MGNLQWSAAKTVKSGTMIVVSANFPEGKKAQEETWNLWRMKKDAVKADGFSIAKDKNDNSWKITYFHTIDDDTYEKTTSGQHMWKSDLDKKVKKWEAVVGQIRGFMSEKVESEVLDDKISSKGIKSIRDEMTEVETERTPKKSPAKVELEYEGNDDDDLAELEKMLRKVNKNQ
jgi:hypothetical protein